MSKTKVKGNEGMLYLYDETAEAYRPIVCATSNGVSSTREQNEDEPTKCDPIITEFTPGRTDSTYEFAGQSNLVDGTSKSYFEIREAQKAGIVNWKYVYNLQADPSDLKEDYFAGLVTDLSKEQNVNQVSTFTFTVRVNGEISDVDPFAPAV